MASQVENIVSSKESRSPDTNFEFVAIDGKLINEPMSEEDLETNVARETNPTFSAAESETEEIEADGLSEDVSMSFLTSSGHFLDSSVVDEKEGDSGMCVEEEETHCIEEEFCRAEISQGADESNGHKVEDYFMPAECKGSSGSKPRIVNHVHRYQSFAPPVSVSEIISSSFSCSECALRFQTRLRLKKHLGVRHGKPFLCIHCPAAFAKSGELTMHMPSHTAERVFLCVQCRRTFKNRESLVQHLTSHSKQRDESESPQVDASTLPSGSSFSCPHCGLKFRTEQLVEQHAVMHLGERPFSCILCPSRFKLKSRLVRHLAKHSDETFACSKCSSKFKNGKSLAAHSCSIEKVYSCTFCSAHYKFRSSLNSHLATHSEERPFSCVVCAVVFKTKDSLKKHTVAVHVRSEEKSFSCSHCTAAYKYKGDLKRHMALHSDRKQFTCWYCPAAFTRKSSLNVHMAGHSNAKHFSCVHCAATFKTSSSLEKHSTVCPK